MIKKIAYIWLLAAIGIMAACTEDTFVDNRTKVDDDHLLVTFRTHVPEMAQVTTRNADPDGLGIQQLSMFCFDKAGDFISCVTPEQTVNQDMLSGTFEAVVPKFTKIIHFVANQNLESFNEQGNVGRHENSIIPGLISSSSMLVYWGRVECPDNQELDDYIQNTLPDKTVPLYRNQAKITFDGGDLFVVTGFAVCNGYAFGTVAPFNTETKKFDWSNTSNYLSLPNDRTKFTDPTEVNETDTEYVFESDNPSADQMYAVFRGYPQNNPDAELYYRVSLLDGNTQEPLSIIRNHHYKIKITGNLENGVPTFKAALNTPPVNNIWISIDEDIPEVSDGEHKLIVDETFVVYDSGEEGAQGRQKVLKYTYGTDTDPMKPVSEAEKPTVTWMDNNVAAPGISNNYDISTGQGTIGIELLSLGNNIKREGTILVKKGKLQRTIKVIFMKEMEFTPAWVTTQLNGNEYGEGVTLMFNIPQNTPAELFPMTVRIGANQLTPDEALNKLDVINRTSASKEEWGEDIEIDGEPIGFKYTFVAQEPGTQRVYFKTDLMKTEASQVSIESDHFVTVTKFFTFSNSEVGTIEVLNTLQYGDLNVKYLLVPRKVNYRVDMLYEFSQATGRDNQFMFYSRYLDHYTDKELEELGMIDDKECNFEPVDEDLWDTGGRVFLFTPITQGQKRYNTFMKTNTPESAEVVRISTYPGATGTPEGDVVMYKSTTFELANYRAFDFGMEINNGQRSITYQPGQKVTLTFNIEEFEAADKKNVDPYGTPFKIYIDAPMLEFDETAEENRKYAGKITAEAQRTIYQVAKTKAEEDNYGTDGRRTLVFKTNKIVSAGDITISAEKEIVTFNTQTVQLTNSPMTGTIYYKEDESAAQEYPVPAGAFVTFERSGDGTRIGTMIIDEEGKFSLKLKPEYQYDWATVQVQVHYRKTEGTSTVIYHTDTSLPDLVQNTEKLVLIREKNT